MAETYICSGPIAEANVFLLVHQNPLDLGHDVLLQGKLKVINQQKKYFTSLCNV